MEDNIPQKTSQSGELENTFWSNHKLALLIISTVLISIVLTVVSVTIYNISGAAQLDLSRPGYKSVADKVDKEESVEEYSTSGPVNEDSIKEFIKLYDKQSASAKSVEAFNGDPLNPELLQLAEVNQ